MSHLINLLGGPGSGKSTTAAGIFYEMKLRHVSVELCYEYVKKWAWEGRTPTAFDQLYIAGHQAKIEFDKFKRVDWIVTDSPVILGGFYEAKYHGTGMALPSIQKYMEQAQKHGVVFHNFLLSRVKRYDPRGRFQTEAEAREIDGELSDFLTAQGMAFTKVGPEVGERERVNWIINQLGIATE